MAKNLHTLRPQKNAARRHLAAVLAADMVGYSKQMNEDANRTLANLRRLRVELFSPLVAGHNGKLVKNMGDGWIVTFESSIDAVTCAMRVQDKLVTESNINLRIGIHMGDVLNQDDDVFGDAVNIASRLEALCLPGGLVISDAVFGGLDGTLRPAFDPGGDHELKNIPIPVRVWTRGGLVGVAETRALENRSGFPNLNIVSFVVSDDDPETRDLADALTHDLVTYLGSSDWLDCVIKAKPDRGAFRLIGKLRASGNRLRLETDLISPEGKNIWAGKHDGSKEDTFDWQDQTGEAITGQVFGALLDRISAKLAAKGEVEMTAEDWAVKSVLVARFDRKSFYDGLRCVEKMIGLKPEWPYPYEWGSAFLTSASILQFKDIVDGYALVRQTWLDKAMELTGGSSSSRAIIAFSQYAQFGDVAEARKDLNSFLRDLPFNPEALMMAGYMSLFIGDPQTALDCFSRFYTVGRYHPFMVACGAGFGGAYLMSGRFEDAVEELNKAILSFPNYSGSYRYLAAALAQLGRINEAQAALVKMKELVPDVTISGIRRAGGYVDTLGTRYYFDGLKIAGMPE
jgi:adenylate cyclase